MPEQFTVTNVQRAPEKDWSNSYGQFHVYRLGVRNSMRAADAAEVSRKPNSPQIQVGEVIEGDLEPQGPDYPPKFKIAQGWRPAGGLHQMNNAATSAGLSGPDRLADDRTARIERQACMKVAVELPGVKTIEHVKEATLKLEAFVAEAGKPDEPEVPDFEYPNVGDTPDDDIPF